MYTATLAVKYKGIGLYKLAGIGYGTSWELCHELHAAQAWVPYLPRQGPKSNINNVAWAYGTTLYLYGKIGLWSD